MPASPAQVASVRAFNRFHTRLVGALDRRILDSPHSLTELRVLFEIAHGRDLTAAALAKALRLDPAYLSRVLAKLAALGLIDKRPSASDGRASTLRLTRAGRAAFDGLDRAADAEAAATLAPLSRARRAQGRRGDGDDHERSCRSSPPPTRRSSFAVMRPATSAGSSTAMGRFTPPNTVGTRPLKGSSPRLPAASSRPTIPTRERCWVAEREGEILGSVFVVDAGEGVAKLRLLYVEPAARGGGLGRRLVDEALRFAARVGYQQDDVVDQRHPCRGAAHL